MDSHGSPEFGTAIRTQLDMFKHNFSVWIKDTFTPPCQKKVESYLADSTDLCDLERRIVILQRRGMV
jgi:hypothetical protein